MAEIDWDEARRYLGLGRNGGPADPALDERLRSCGAELTAAARPRWVWRPFPLELGEGRVSCAGMDIESAHLRRHLEGCTGAVLFAATLGVGVDRLIARSGAGRVSDAAVYQAAGAALIEEVCDTANDALRAESEAEGWYLRPRFSPGYGDFPIACQPEIARLLRTPERIGLTVTDSMLLVPVKSVTAVIGRSRQAIACHRQGCEACGKTDCAFRRDQA